MQTGVFHHGHNFGNLNISPYLVPGDPESGVVPLVSTEAPGNYGEADNRLQAYCFRMCLTKTPENRVQIERPENYDPPQFELLARVMDAGGRETAYNFV